MDNTQQIQQKSILENDIVLLERKQEQLTSNVDNTFKAHAKQLDIFKRDIQRLETEKGGLEQDIKSLTQQKDILEKSVTSTRENLKHFVETETEKLDAVVKTRMFDVDGKERKIAEIERELTTLNESLKEKGTELATLSNNLHHRKLELDARETAMAERVKQVEGLVKQTEHDVKTLINTKGSLEKSVLSLTTEQNELLAKIDTKQSELGTLITQSIQIKADQRSIKLDLDAKEELLTKRATELDNKEKWLEDREKTLARNLERMKNAN